MKNNNLRDLVIFVTIFITLFLLGLATAPAATAKTATAECGTEFRFNKATRLNCPDEVLKIWAGLPDGIKAVANVVEFHDKESPATKHWRLEFDNPEFVIAATADVDNLSVDFWRGIGGKLTTTAIRELLVHEAGHLLDGANGYISKTDRWAGAMKMDRSLSGLQSPTNYGRHNVGEDFAESVWLYVSDEDFAKKFPNRAKIIAELLEPSESEGELEGELLGGLEA